MENHSDPFSCLRDFYLSEKQAFNQLNKLDHRIQQERQHFLGYPCNANFDFNGFFKWWEKSCLSKSPLNEVGSPYTATFYNLNTHAYERKVLEFFSNLYHIQQPWGYVTSGGTQGNEQGLYLGRELLARHGRPILYFSEEAHYSIGSLGRVLGLECCRIHSQPSGEMDYEDLRKRLDQDRPALFSLSIGTTFKGAIDRIEVIHQMIQEKSIEHAYYHADAALFGGYLPFYLHEDVPQLNFTKHPYDSIAVSGHKFFGSPVPMGIFLTRNSWIEQIKPDFIEYIDAYNLTIPCSRSSLNTLLFWWILSTQTIESFVERTNRMFENTHYLYTELQKRHYPVWLNPYSNTVYFKSPSYSICKKWTLSQMTCRYAGPLAHAIVMNHVSKELLDSFLEDLDHELGLHLESTG